MATKVGSKNRKKHGRPSLTTEQEAAEIARLYFDLDWTARKIRETLFPSLRDDTIRSIAKRTRDLETANDSAPLSGKSRGESSDTMQADRQLHCVPGATPSATATKVS